MNIRFYNARILAPSEGHSFQVITGELWVKKNEIIYIGDGLDTERVFEKEPAGMILWDREIDAGKNLRIAYTAKVAAAEKVEKVNAATLIFTIAPAIGNS